MTVASAEGRPIGSALVVPRRRRVVASRGGGGGRLMFAPSSKNPASSIRSLERRRALGAGTNNVGRRGGASRGGVARAEGAGFPGSVLRDLGGGGSHRHRGRGRGCCPKYRGPVDPGGGRRPPPEPNNVSKRRTTGSSAGIGDLCLRLRLCLGHVVVEQNACACCEFAIFFP